MKMNVYGAYFDTEKDGKFVYFEYVSSQHEESLINKRNAVDSYNFQFNHNYSNEYNTDLIRQSKFIRVADCCDCIKLSRYGNHRDDCRLCETNCKRCNQRDMRESEGSNADSN